MIRSVVIGAAPLTACLVLFTAAGALAQSRSQAPSGRPGASSVEESDPYEYRQDGYGFGYGYAWDPYDTGVRAPSGAQRAARTPEGAPAAPEYGHLSGEVLAVKLEDVLGSDEPHGIVLLYTPRGNQVTVDLGPESKLRRLYVRAGDFITVNGELTTVGGRTLVLAEQLLARGQTTQIERPKREARRPVQRRPGPVLQGEVVGWRQVQSMGDLHEIVLVETERGERISVDLGETPRVRLERGDRVRIEGRLMTLAGQELLVAEQIELEGRRSQERARQPREYEREQFPRDRTEYGRAYGTRNDRRYDW